MTDELPQQDADAGGRGAGRPPVWFSFRRLLRTRIVAGLLTVIPIWVTWVVAKFVFDTMKSATEPIAWGIARMVQEGQKEYVPPVSGEYDRVLISKAVTRLMQDTADDMAQGMRQEEAIDRVARKLTYALEKVPDAPADYFSETYLKWIVPLLAVMLTLFLLYLLGLLTASVFGRRLILLLERIFRKLPLVKTIYGSTKQVVMTLGGSESMEFKRVVLVEFPRPGMKCIGFLTAVMKDVDTGRDMASIFISTTPNPTTGYMQIVPLDEVSETSWTVEEAVKLLMSGGVLSPPGVAFDKIHPVKSPPRPGSGAPEAPAKVPAKSAT